MSKSSTFHVLEDEHEHEPDFGFIVAGHHHVVNCMVVFPFFLKKKKYNDSILTSFSYVHTALGCPGRCLRFGGFIPGRALLLLHLL